MRLFVAINMPPHLQAAIYTATAELRVVGEGISWTPEERIHLTLEFLGDVEESALPPLRDALEGLAWRRPMPWVSIGGIGAFPSFTRPRVVWMGVANEPLLEAIQRDVATTCARLGYEPDARPFRPHLTIGRVRRRLSASEAKRLEDAAGRIDFQGGFVVSTVDLMQSIAGKGGHRYELLLATPLDPARPLDRV